MTTSEKDKMLSNSPDETKGRIEMMEQQEKEIDSYVTHLIEKIEGLSLGYKDGRVSKEDFKSRINVLILDFASFLESKGHRLDDIYDEILHLLNDRTAERWIYHILHNTRFLPSVRLKVYEEYTNVYDQIGSKVAYIHEDVMT